MELPNKPDVARALLLKGSVFVHLDPRVDDVAVPDQFKAEEQLTLQFGLDMALPIPDLRTDEESISGTLSFSRRPFTCHVPWEAVFAMFGDDGRGMVWPESMPEGALDKQPPAKAHQPTALEGRSVGASGTRKPRAKRPSYLRVVK